MHIYVHACMTELIHEQTSGGKYMNNGENEYGNEYGERTVFEGDRPEGDDGNKDAGEVAITFHVERMDIRTPPPLPQRSCLHIFSVIVYLFHVLFFCAFLAILSIAIAREDVLLNNVRL